MWSTPPGSRRTPTASMFWWHWCPLCVLQRTLAARSALVLAQQSYEQFAQARLVQPFEQSLQHKQKLMDATMKALGAGLGAFAFREVEVVRDDDSGAPSLALHGAAAELARSRGVRAWQVSLTHTDATAMAVVLALG